jgi:xylulokinase
MSPNAAATFALGIDLGTSAVKVVALDGDGRVAGSGAGDFPTNSELPGQAEQNPADWLGAVARAVTALARDLDPRVPHWREQIAAIGLAGQLPTLVCLDDRGAIGSAITWKDARADAWASTVIDARKRRAIYERTGMPVDGRYLGPMLRYHWPAHRDGLQAVLSAKDYLCYVLTGVCVTDPSTAAGFGAYDLASKAFSADLCAHWDLPMHALPPVRDAHSTAGFLSDAGAQLLGLAPGIPVTVGAADSVAGAYALAGLEEGIVCVSMGSSTIIIDAIRERRLDPATRYLLTPHVEPGWYGREMDLLATGTGHRWLSGLFGWAEGQLDGYAAQSAPGAHGLIFAPYLAGGEQGALWDPNLRGALGGLTLRHAARDIARAFLEGVYFEIRRCIDVLAESAPVRGIVVTGGVVDHASSLQMLADILQQPVQPARAVSSAAEGAALGAHSLRGAAPGPGARAVALPRVAPGDGSARYQQLCAPSAFATCSGPSPMPSSPCRPAIRRWDSMPSWSGGPTPASCVSTLRAISTWTTTGAWRRTIR